MWVDSDYLIAKLYIEQDNQYLDRELKDIIQTNRKADPDILLGNSYEISTDIELDDDMRFFEGTFRTPDEFWKLLLARVKPEAKEVKHEKYTWSTTGIETIEAVFPENEAISIQGLKMVLNHYYPDATDWKLVHGPDSMTFR